MKLVILLISFLISPITFALSPQAVDSLTQQYTPEAFVGMMVSDVNTQKIIYQQNADKAFSPASNAKLFTALAALYGLGPDYHFTTRILIDSNQLKAKTLNGNLYIQFSGDPSLRIEDLNTLIKTISQNIQTIHGNIILDDSRFQRPFHPMGTLYEDMNWYFEAPASTIILDRNMVIMQLQPAKQLAGLTTIKLMKNTQYITVDSHIMTVTKDQADHHCRLLLDISNDNHADLQGCWPIKGYPNEISIAVKNPALFAQKILTEQLANHHIQLQGKIQTGKIPNTPLKTIATHDSPPLKILLKIMLKKSNNLYARMIVRALGEKYFKQATIQEGANAIKLVLQKYAHLDLKNAKLYDAAGAYYTLVTPRQITQLLDAAYHSPYRKIFMDALPTSSKREDSTLHTIITFRQLPKNIIAKTGSMKGVSTLSGYMINKDHVWIFSILVNNIVDKIKKGEQLQVAICQRLNQDISLK